MDAAEVDKSRLQKLLREGIYVEYHGRKVLEAKTFENNCHVLLNFHIFFLTFENKRDSIPKIMSDGTSVLVVGDSYPRRIPRIEPCAVTFSSHYIYPDPRCKNGYGKP